MRILIVGAGPAGLTAAVELARRGIETDIIDRQDARSTLSRAVGITPRSLEILEPSGVAARLLGEGIKIRKARFYSGCDLIAEVPFQVRNIRHGHDYLLALAQDRTEACLADVYRELGGSVRYGEEFIALEERDGRLAVTLADGRTDIYDHVIGADGVHSTVRHAAGLDYPGYDLKETWSIADVDAPGWQNAGLFTACLLPGGNVAVVVPLEATRYRVVASTEDALRDLSLPLEPAKVRRQATFTISVRHVADYRREGVFLAGDAAHCHSPVGGRGMNLGIADSVELAQRMAEGTLEGYGAARHADAARTIAASERARGFVTSTNPLARLFLAGALKSAAALPFVRQRFSEAVLYT